MAKYDSTSIPMAESLAKLNLFMTRYSAFLQVHVPPTHFPQQCLLVTAFKMRVDRKEPFDEHPLFILKTTVLEKPAKVRKASRAGAHYEITENDVYARRWQSYVEHLITFVLESPEGIRRDVMYRHLGGYLQTANGQNLLDTMKRQLGKAMEQGELPTKLSLWDDRFDQSRALGAGEEGGA